MRLRLMCSIYAFAIVGILQGQDVFEKGEIIDSRDGKVYQTITLSNTIWLIENMNFQTGNEKIIAKNDLGIVTDGYYYSYEEADLVCPKDFQLPNESDWEEYIDVLIDLKNIPNTSIKRHTSKSNRVSGSGILVLDNKLQIFNDPNPLKLTISGIVQGDNLLHDDALTFWSRKDNTLDSKYHLHITSNDYSNHTHKHHIIDKKKKKRKFVVRCVKKNITPQSAKH